MLSNAVCKEFKLHKCPGIRVENNHMKLIESLKKIYIRHTVLSPRYYEHSSLRWPMSENPISVDRLRLIERTTHRATRRSSTYAGFSRVRVGVYCVVVPTYIPSV